MNSRWTATAALLLTTTGAAVQASEAAYNVEAGVLSSRLRNDDQTAMGTFALGATFYPSPVRFDPAQPFAELDFLQKASQFTLIQTSYSFSGSQVIADTTATDLMFDGLVYLDRLALGFTHSTGSMMLSPVGANWMGYDVSTTSTTLRVGYRWLPQTQINLAHGQSVDTYSGPSGWPAISDDRLSWNRLSIRSVATLNNGRFLVIDLEGKQKDRTQGSTRASTQALGAQLRAYPSPNLYLEAGLNQESGDPSNTTGRTLSYGAGVSLSNRLILQVYGSKFTATDPSQYSSDRELGFSLSLRF